MIFSRLTWLISVVLLLSACGTSKRASRAPENVPAVKTVTPTNTRKKTFTKPIPVDRHAFVSFAKTLLGTPYKYASAIPANGLDCSGFIYYVFNHFNIRAPRSSVDFTNEGSTVDLQDARPGDLILFTGSDNASGIVGHMGIVIENGPVLKFIHSSSGKSVGVIINPLSGYYKTHFVKVIRILE
jgi:cell wall-associated NlpC family hydrolase